MAQKCNILFLLCIAFISKSYGIQIDLKEILQRTQNKNTCDKIPALWDLSTYYHLIEDDKVKADSVGQLAIKLSEQEKDKNYIIQSYIIYAKHCTENHYASADIYLQKGISLAQKKKLHSHEFKLVAEHALLLKKQNKAKEAQIAILTAQPLVNNSLENLFLYNLTVAQTHDAAVDMILALDNYNRATEVASQLNNDSLLVLALGESARYRTKQSLYAKAQQCLDQAKEIIAENEQFTIYDKLYLQFIQLELIAAHQPSLLYNAGNDLIMACDSLHFTKLSNNAMSAMRLCFMKNNDRKSLCDMYCQNRFQPHLTHLQKDVPNMYYRIQALLQENNQHIDSAKLFWRSSELLLKEEPNNVYLGNFYLRYGQFLARNGYADSAIQKLQLAYSLAQKSAYLPLMIEVTNNMDSVYYKNNMLPLAYLALKENKNLTDSNNLLLQQETRFMIESQSNRRLENIDAQKVIDDKKRGYYFQLYAIGFLALLLIYLLLFLSKKTISIQGLKFFGYITFVFLFEFFIFLLHKIFHHITEEPFLLMMMNVTLIAILLPIHHATEHRVLHYLIKRNRLKQETMGFKQWIQDKITSYRNWLAVNEDKSIEGE